MSFNWSGYRPVSIIFTTIYSLLYMSFLKRVFVTDRTGPKIFIFINAMIFAFMTFVTNGSQVWEKKFSKYFTSFFGMLHRASNSSFFCLNDIPPIALMAQCIDISLIKIIKHTFRGLCATALDWLLKESSATKASLNSLNLKDASWVKKYSVKTLIWIRPPVQPDFSFCHDQCWKIAQLRADFTFKQIKTSSANL